ncbi:biopolymer transporter ExbD [Leptospira interrogans]|uniref:Transport energizing protein, ExbD/TolR family n=4 Tax=Leptospira interrogans TaxID=173 RepID=M3IC49_LEPIR|nr:MULTISPECIES: biopolymer transporter ExbD [Leptospira]EMG12951.1 transport energizing protein, ExbD/TolR family [Leptospira interrogans serovar Grippotyphosa str. LT2186]EJO77418.1 transport energizing protein, ExbD/TolR family [Leptospira interrogans serovar Pomona str. Kennewicki LC82-25]EJP16018.1 transport energizing protein, ExbD/TolR family [Leptospira interrogans str. FPW2026]EKN95443.1 transport energizing protein, ExbD/TolR family [Leptospira interrogans serovar Pomona str. Pomona]
MKKNLQKRKRLLENEDSNLDMTSMLDVVFILLIFAMVAMSFQKEVHSLPVNLPKGKTESNGSGIKKEIFLLKDGNIRYTKQYFSENTWIQFISQGEFKNQIVWIYGDEKVDYGKFVFVINSLKNSNLKELHLAVKKE